MRHQGQEEEIQQGVNEEEDEDEELEDCIRIYSDAVSDFTRNIKKSISSTLNMYTSKMQAKEEFRSIMDRIIREHLDDDIREAISEAIDSIK